MYLSIDSSNNLLSMCLFNEDGIIDSLCSNNKHQQTQELFLYLQQLLDNNNYTIKNIREIIVSIGPGSFTGIRVALAATTGIKIASNIKISGITNFQSLAYNAKKTHNIKNDFTVILEAFRSEYYCQKFNDQLHAIEEPFLISNNDIANIENIATNLELQNNIYPVINNKNNSYLMAQAFFHYKKLGLLHKDTPLYIRDAV
jgi:tRNA threonylcarbamoyladenosine biosynthesis protein TsaB